MKMRKATLESSKLIRVPREKTALAFEFIAQNFVDNITIRVFQISADLDSPDFEIKFEKQNAEMILDMVTYINNN